jgi:hypothetical protein
MEKEKMRGDTQTAGRSHEFSNKNYGGDIQRDGQTQKDMQTDRHRRIQRHKPPFTFFKTRKVD